MKFFPLRELHFISLSLIAIFLCVHTQSAVAGWDSQGSNSVLEVYTDAASVHEVAGKRRIKMLHDFKTTQTDRTGFRYQSTLFFMEFDCGSNSYALYSTVKFSGHLAGGSVVDRSFLTIPVTDSIRADSAEGAARQVACSATATARVPQSEQQAWGGSPIAQGGGSGQRQSTQQQSGQGFSWDSWMQATGNAPLPTPRVESVKVTGKATFSVDQVKRACANVMRSTMWSVTINMGMNADGTLAAVSFLQAVDSSEVGGPLRTMLPKGRVTPAKISFLFPRNVRIDDAKVYLFQDSFGDAKCLGPA